MKLEAGKVPAQPCGSERVREAFVPVRVVAMALPQKRVMRFMSRCRYAEGSGCVEIGQLDLWREDFRFHAKGNTAKPEAACCRSKESPPL
ncbi:hypothetical protein [Cupriavidus numazuensis]|uniref:hypothetical protein n=1 Tax=Cupriavidus numazuensis TaxID=221992 RepID=UPI001BADB19A|nr:hypothetical protein [Cupriavidus numazuensis]